MAYPARLPAQAYRSSRSVTASIGVDATRSSFSHNRNIAGRPMLAAGIIACSGARNEARRIAANVAKLPELLRRSPAISEL